METSKAMDILFSSRNVIFSSVELKAAFRRMSLLRHPDMGGTTEGFVELQQAYDKLSQLVQESQDKKGILEKRTTDLTLLSELGQGFPLNVSAKTCSSCKGIGYLVFQDKVQGNLEECPLCFGYGIASNVCNRCKGTGRYKHPNTGKEIGECFGCKGTGRFFIRLHKSNLFAWKFLIPKYIPGTQFRGLPCSECHGTGQAFVFTTDTTEKEIYHRCDECEGVGEIKMWNPVLPRGYLAK